MNNSSPTTRLHRRFVLVSVVALLALGAAGCDDKAKPSEGASTSVEAGIAAPAATPKPAGGPVIPKGVVFEAAGQKGPGAIATGGAPAEAPSSAASAPPSASAK